MTAPYDHQALWNKAKAFLNRAMDGDRAFDESALWASAALELLGKAALSRVSPVLIAEPTEQGENLLIALGLVEGEANFNSVAAKTIWLRCARAFKPFNANEAKLIADNRNEYLHGSSVGFGAIPAVAWWPRYWAQVAILVGALDTDLEALVGPSRVALVEHELAQNAKNLESRAQSLIERAKQRVAQKGSAHVSARVYRELNDPRPLDAGLSHRETVECPACSAIALLEGDDVLDADVNWLQTSEGEFEATVTLTVSSEYFSCNYCRLELDGPELIAIAGLPGQFVTEGDINDVHDLEYGND